MYLYFSFVKHTEKLTNSKEGFEGMELGYVGQLK